MKTHLGALLLAVAGPPHGPLDGPRLEGRVTRAGEAVERFDLALSHATGAPRRLRFNHARNGRFTLGATPSPVTLVRAWSADAGWGPPVRPDGDGAPLELQLPVAVRERHLGPPPNRPAPSPNATTTRCVEVRMRASITPDLPPDLSLRLTARDAHGDIRSVDAPLDAGSWAAVETSLGAPGGSLILDAVRGAGTGHEVLLASRRVALDTDLVVAELDVPPLPRRLTVVDPAGVPLPGVDVTLARTFDGSGWSAWSTTDARGESPIPHADAPLYATLAKDDHGLAIDLPLPPPDATGRSRLLFDPTTPIGLRVQDGETPLAGIPLRLHGALTGEARRALSSRGVEHPRGLGYAGLPLVDLRSGISVVLDDPRLWPVRVGVAPRWQERVLEVRRLGDLEVRVESGGKPAARIELSLLNLEWRASVGRWVKEGRVRSSSFGPRLWTDLRGRLTLEGLPHGDYAVRIGNGPERATHSVHVPIRRRAVLNLRLEGSGSR